MAKIKFGPSGNSDSFRDDENCKHTKDVPLYLHSRGLDCYEFSFGRGVNMGMETAQNLQPMFANYNIEISGHCPYYINLATEEEDKAVKNIGYIMDTMKVVETLGGNRSVFHPGSPKKMPRLDAMNMAINRLELLLGAIYGGGYQSHKLAIESMGKAGQLGNCEEVIELCKRDPMLLPCIDFGHVNAREQGVLKTADDYKKLLDKYIEGLGFDKIDNMHVHFSKIEYTAKGEVRHLTFQDNTYGPDYEPLLEVLNQYNLHPYIICESAGTQAEDAKTMKNYYESLNISKKNNN